MAVVSLRKGCRELRLCVERLHDPHAQQGFLQHRHQLTEFFFPLLGVALQPFGPAADQRTRHWQKYEGKQRQLPTQSQQGRQTHKHHERRLQQRFQRTNHRVLHFHQVVGEATHDVPALGLREPGHRHGHELAVKVLSQISTDPSPNARHNVERRVLHGIFQKGQHHHRAAQRRERHGRAFSLYKFIKSQADPRQHPFLGIRTGRCPKQNAQKRHHGQKREQRQNGAQRMEHPHQQHLASLVTNQRNQGPDGPHPRTKSEANPR